MKKLFIQLTLANLTLLLLVTIWGHFISSEQASKSAFDVLVGIVAVFTAFIHSVIYTYFIATAKFVERAVEEHGYSKPDAINQAKSNKRKSFRYAFLAMFITMTAAFLTYWGSRAIRHDLAIWRGWPPIASYLAILTNIYAAKIEWKYILANGVITDDILNTVSDLNP